MDEQAWKMWYKYTMEYYFAEREGERGDGREGRPTLIFSGSITS